MMSSHREDRSKELEKWRANPPDKCNGEKRRIEWVTITIWLHFIVVNKLFQFINNNNNYPINTAWVRTAGPMMPVMSTTPYSIWFAINFCAILLRHLRLVHEDYIARRVERRAYWQWNYFCFSTILNWIHLSCDGTETNNNHYKFLVRD